MRASSRQPHLPEAASRFILYARKSNDREDRQIRSLGDQNNLAVEEAKRAGIRIVHKIPESKSAKRPGMRPGFQEMLDWIEQGKADGILCWHPDRLARNAVDGAWILDLLDRGKLKDLHFLSYHFDNSPEGKFALGMVFSQAKYQVDKLSGDVSRGMREMRQEGGFPHYVPEGYKNVRLDNGTKAVEKDPYRFPLLRRAVDVILAEVYPPAEVRRMLNGWGYRTRTTKERTGGPMAEGGFYRIFHNPFYCGLCKDGDTYYDGQHEPLMSKEEFTRLQRILTRGIHPVSRKHTYAYARGLFTCGRCGCQITATLAKGKSGKGAWIYYHCTNRKGVCDKRGIREDLLETPVRSLLERLTIPVDLEPIIADLAQRYVRDGVRADAQVETGATERLGEARGERARLVELLAKGVLTTLDFMPARDALNAEIQELEAGLAKASSRESVDAEIVRNVVEFAAHARDAFDAATPEVKRWIVKMLTTDRVLTPQNPLLKPHPYLVGFLNQPAVVQTFKPLKIDSYSKKVSLPVGRLTSGSPNISRNKLSESVLLACRAIAQTLACAVISDGVMFESLHQVQEANKGQGAQRKDRQHA